MRIRCCMGYILLKTGEQGGAVNSALGLKAQSRPSFGQSVLGVGVIMPVDGLPVSFLLGVFTPSGVCVSFTVFTGHKVATIFTTQSDLVYIDNVRFKGPCH